MSALLAADWPAPPGVVAFTTLRTGAGISQAPFDSFNLGMRCGDDAGAVAYNRGELIQRFALPSPPRWLRQVHGTTVFHFDDTPIVCHSERSEESDAASEARSLTAFGMTSESAGGEGAADEPEADAAVTATPGSVLAILTADCLPVVFASDDGSEVAAAHAGWRGLAAGVLEATLAAMQAAPGRVLAWLGPCAGPQAYEVGEEVLDAFLAHDPRATAAFAASRPGHWHVDLYSLARQRLLAAGVPRVHGGDLCTISDPQRFFSHRRDQRTGRMATLAWRNLVP